MISTFRLSFAAGSPSSDDPGIRDASLDCDSFRAADLTRASSPRARLGWPCHDTQSGWERSSGWQWIGGEIPPVE